MMNIESKNGTSCHGSLAIVLPMGFSDFFCASVAMVLATRTIPNAPSDTIHISTPIYEDIASIIVARHSTTSPITRQGLLSIVTSLSCAFIGRESFFRNIRYSIAREVRPANIVGSAITPTYSAKPTFIDVARYMFVGLPIIKNILYVFAATNSVKINGIGSMSQFRAK